MTCFRNVVCLILASASAAAFAQEDPARTRQIQEAMSKLSFLEGTWKGPGIMMSPQGKSEAAVTEVASFKLQRSIFMFEGLGTVDLPNGEKRIVHDAMGIISYDADAKQYRMRTYRTGGESLDPEFELNDQTIVWKFKHPQAGDIRFTLTVTEDGKWHETGEFSRDGGRNWFNFFEMNLEKQETA